VALPVPIEELASAPAAEAIADALAEGVSAPSRR
jgi:hypothetical protein